MAKPRPNKQIYNPINAAILSLFGGSGNIYLGLYKRFVVAIILTVIIVYTLIKTFPGYGEYISIIWLLYMARDSFICCNCLNKHKRLPKFLTYLDIK